MAEKIPATLMQSIEFTIKQYIVWLNELMGVLNKIPSDYFLNKYQTEVKKIFIKPDQVNVKNLLGMMDKISKNPNEIKVSDIIHLLFDTVNVLRDYVNLLSEEFNRDITTKPKLIPKRTE